MRSSQNKPTAKFAREQLWPLVGGPLDLSVPMLHPRNLPIFLALCDHQTPGLYGTSSKATSTPPPLGESCARGS
jgi:hypothetical protein